MISKLTDILGGKVIRKLVSKYRPKMVCSIIILAILSIIAVFILGWLWTL